MIKKAIISMYHDVVEPEQPDSSGFPGNAAYRYKLDVNDFEKHLESIAKAIKNKPVTIFEAFEQKSGIKPYMITFDDGGISAYSVIAPLLDNYGWKGHFFITTDYINKDGFVTDEQIKELKRRGHIIGSHSCSHPTRMSKLTKEQMMDEWTRSIDVLSDILDEKITIASVPGGYYSRLVGETAAACGIKTLFTSEPVQKIHFVDGCMILGRYTMFREFSPEFAGRLASGSFPACFSQYSYWNLKKIGKKFAGNLYLKLRDYLFEK